MSEKRQEKEAPTTLTSKRSKPAAESPLYKRPADFFYYDMTSLREPLLKVYYIAVVCEHSNKKWELKPEADALVLSPLLMKAWDLKKASARDLT